MEPRHRHLHPRRKSPHSHTKRIDVVTDVVYVTASPTLGGKVVGFSTLGEPIVAKTTTEAPTPKVVTTAQPTTTNAPPPATTESAESTSDASSVTSDTSSDSSTLTSSTTSSETVPTTTESALESVSAFSQTSSVPSASSTSATSEPVEGPSTGMKVGLALAGVMAFLVLCSVIIFIYRKKSRQRSQEAYGKPEDEKAGDQAGVYNNRLSRTTTVTSEQAPRVPSMRPVTRFLPDLTVTPPPTVNSEPNTQSRQAPATNPQSGLVRSESRKAVPPPLVLTKSEGVGSSGPPSAATMNSTAPLINRSQPSPAASTFSADYTDAGSSVVGTPVTTTPVPAAASNTSPVHRVQMDFKPSMGDELELRIGQLVRLLHEYDDGWALCIRLDRSQQGVCPRTCLSQRPVKPRPQGPPPGARGPPRPGYGPNSRPQSPMGNRGPPRPYSPAGGPRAQSPGPNGVQFPHPRPQSPANSRPHSPAGGYSKKQYQPATPQQAIPISPIQSPPIAISQSIPAVLRTGPAQVTMTTDIPDGGPAMPKQQSPPGSPPRPAVAPVRPSPLSHEQNNGAEPHQTQPVFHAM